MFKVVEKFISINGEGRRAGQLAVFIRFKGCNLNCSYCDTSWANEKDAPYTLMSSKEIYDYIVETGVKNVTLTGGEPLIQDNIGELIGMMAENPDIRTEIETNGSVDLTPFAAIRNSLGEIAGRALSFTMDYKQPSSGMENHMCLKNFSLLKENDTVKFVSGSEEDLLKAKEIIEAYGLNSKCAVYLSPVFGKIEPSDMVEFLVKNRMNDINIQLQLHKFIWNPDERGV